MTRSNLEMPKFIPFTKAQERRFYREAVRETLVTIYGRSVQDSRNLVAAWWKRASESGALQSPIFFHAEPLHVAADISHTPSIAITTENEETYREILHRARKQALENSGSSRVILKPIPSGRLRRDVSVKSA